MHTHDVPNALNTAQDGLRGGLHNTAPLPLLRCPLLRLRQVVSGDEGGTLVMWDAQSGAREGGFAIHSRAQRASSTRCPGGLAPTAPKLTAMAFDAAQRRLLTAAAGGVVQLFNPHSGAELRRFEAPQRRRGRGQGLGQGPEITAVAIVPGQLQQKGLEAPQWEPTLEPSQRRHGSTGADGLELEPSSCISSREVGGRSCRACSRVLATGWGRSLCVWEEGEEERCAPHCQRLQGHTAGVLCLEALGSDGDIVATGGRRILSCCSCAGPPSTTPHYHTATPHCPLQAMAQARCASGTCPRAAAWQHSAAAAAE